MKRKKYAYLYRVAMIILVVIFFPTILFLYFFMNRSCEQIESGNRRYCESLAVSFVDHFLTQMEELKQHALVISVDSKNSKSVFWHGSESFAENEYWYYEAVNEMKAYTETYTELYGIYYYESDCIVTNSGTLTSEQYIGMTLKVKEENASIWEYFEEDRYHQGEFVFGTTNSVEDSDGVMLAGYCTTMGKNRDPVLMFSVLNPNEYGKTLGAAYGMEGISFHILDSEKEKVYLSLEETNTDNVMATYEENVGYLPLKVIMAVGKDSYQNDIISFYRDMKLVLWGITSILFITCMIVLYIVYKPVYQLVSEEDEREADEFETIRSMLDERHAKILERETLIIELMLKHLVYRTPVSERKLNQLGISSAYTHYCVFVLEGYTLLSGEIDRITKEAEEKFSVHLLVTDWQDEEKNILIAFMKEQNVVSVDAWLRTWLDKHCAGNYKLLTGIVVEQLDDIRLSFMSCLENEEKQSLDEPENMDKTTEVDIKAANKRERQRQKRNEDILDYVNHHYWDEDLSLTKVADVFGISHYTLSRIFRNQVGVGFTDYVNAKRIEKAKGLLLMSSCSVREVGKIVGFTNDNYFSRIFKTMVGISPMEFREGK